MSATPKSYQSAERIIPTSTTTTTAAAAAVAATWQTPDGWQQGRGAWGGLVIAALLNAATDAVAATNAVAATDAVNTVAEPTRPLRQVMCSIMAPVMVGTQTITTEILRAGSALTVAKSVLCDAAGATCAIAIATFGSDRADDVAPPYKDWGSVRAPELPAFEEVAELPAAPGLAPVFFQHCSFRPVTGWPTSGSLTTSGWLAPRVAPTEWTGPLLLGFVDAWWPCAFSIMPMVRPAATISFSAQILVDPQTVGAGDAFAYESFPSAAHSGYASEVRRLWTRDGRLAVDNMQTIAIIK